MFENVFFPSEEGASHSNDQELSLRRSLTFRPSPKTALSKASLVVFDLETTGLDQNQDRIIEIGAQKIIGGNVVGEYETLIDPQRDFPIEAQKVTGLTPEMLIGKPTIEKVLPDFFNFIDGSILVAHNANFDMGFIKKSASRSGVDLDWPAFCTLKMARELLPELERKTLDKLAEHYGLSFEARHRSIGDVKVTVSVLEKFLKNEGEYIECWQDLEPFCV